jgi:putative DNA primase/helicase
MSKPQGDKGTDSPQNPKLPFDDDEPSEREDANGFDVLDESPVDYSEDDLARIFSDRHNQDWRYVATWSQWLHWNGSIWEKDDTLAVYDLARKICREVSNFGQGLNLTQKRALSASRTFAAVERIVKTDRAHAATAEQWDSDPWALSTPNGVINLRYGHIRPPSRDDYATKTTLVSPDGDCPVWKASLRRWCASDIDLELYLQRFAGYCLTGITSEHALAFFYGTGRNGKSVFLDTIREIMGDYATVAGMEMFQASQHERHSTEIADLMGARLVTAQETQSGRKWDEAKIKELTSAATLKARFMRQDYFEFKPQFKLFFAGNHKPGLRSVDEAMRARVHIVPFLVTIPEAERDQTLPTRLKAEYPGILQWMIDGCIAWREQGLKPPAAVRKATDEYLDSEDSFANWFDDCCTANKNGKETGTDLYKSFKRWAEQSGERYPSAKEFYQTLDVRDFPSKKLNGYKFFYGLELRELVDDGSAFA